MENKTTQLLQAEIMRTRTTVESVFEDINLLNTDIIAIQDDITALNGVIAAQGEQITEAAEKADTAQNTANSALSTADSALSVASEAHDTAEAAQTAVADKYTKPATGIPETDLSADVQTKLNSGGGGSKIYKHTVTFTSTNKKIELYNYFEGAYSELAEALSYMAFSFIKVYWDGGSAFELTGAWEITEDEDLVINAINFNIYDGISIVTKTYSPSQDITDVVTEV